MPEKENPRFKKYETSIELLDDIQESDIEDYIKVFFTFKTKKVEKPIDVYNFERLNEIKKAISKLLPAEIKDEFGFSYDGDKKAIEAYISILKELENFDEIKIRAYEVLELLKDYLNLKKKEDKK